MVMIFSSKKALRQLLKKGIVVSFRKVQPGPDRKHGPEWITDHRCGSKVCDALIFSHDTPVPLTYDTLEPFVEHSGFDSVDEWIGEIKKMNGNTIKIGTYGELYCVVRRDVFDKRKTGECSENI
jgi:hypothetical protein